MNWTCEERIRIVSILLKDIQTDIYANCYSAVGRPNITSVLHILHDPPETLEDYKEILKVYLERWEVEQGVKG